MATAPLLRHDTRNNEGGMPPHWSRSVSGRVLLGIVLSQGLFYGAYYSLAEWIAFDDNQNPFAGFTVSHWCQMGAILVAALLAGAGQTSGGLCGTLIGVLSSLAFIAVQQAQGIPSTTVGLLALPLIALNLGLV